MDLQRYVCMLTMPYNMMIDFWQDNCSKERTATYRNSLDELLSSQPTIVDVNAFIDEFREEHGKMYRELSSLPEELLPAVLAGIAAKKTNRCDD